MSATGLEVFDTTLHKTSVWLGDVMHELNCDDRHKAYLALRAVLHALRDRISIDEAASLGAQLPMLVRGFYFEGWHPADKPLKYRHKDAFLDHVKDELPGFDDRDVETTVVAVLHVLERHVTEGEINQLKRLMPTELRTLWH